MIVNVNLKKSFQAIKYTGDNFEDVKNFIDDNWFDLEAIQQPGGTIMIIHDNKPYTVFSDGTYIVNFINFSFYNEEEFNEKFIIG